MRDDGFLLLALRAGAGAALVATLLISLHATVSDPVTGARLRIVVRTTAGTGRALPMTVIEEAAELVMTLPPAVSVSHASMFRRRSVSRARP